jgi:hypothetical protein
MGDNDIAALAVVCIFGLPVLAWIAVRLMQHRERLEMIRHGMNPPPGAFGKAFSGAAAAAPPPRPARMSDDDPQRMLRKGIVVVAVGFALTIGLGFIGTLPDSGHYTYGPWLLGGLIPLFVGLAQVVIALLSGATFGPPGRGYSPYAGADQQQPSSAPPPNYEGPYAYRPGPTQELQRPAQPPDRR